MLDPPEKNHNTAYSKMARRNPYSLEQPENKQRNSSKNTALENRFTKGQETYSKALSTRRLNYEHMGKTC